jgi:hypothetical protein
MPEVTSNVELALTIHEQGEHLQRHRGSRRKRIEIAEAVVLATVAVATAWSGYQAAKWDAVSARNYGQASRTNVAAQVNAAFAGQDRLYDITTFNGWVAATMGDNTRLAAFYERRFRPEYAVAFAAWKKLDPVNNPAAPPGPIFMPEYASEKAHQSEVLAAEASVYFDAGVSTRETGDKYVRVTVLLATVLLLTALSQRFESSGPRAAVVAIATLLLAISLYSITTLPRV